MTEGSPTIGAPAQRSERLRALAGLSAIGASVGLFMAQAVGPWSAVLFATNALAQPDRLALVACVGAGGLLGALVAMALWASRDAARLPCLARLLAPLALSGFIPGLLSREPQSLDLCLSLAFAVLLSRPLFRLHFRAYEDPWLAGFGAARRGLATRVLGVLPAFLRDRVAFSLAVLAAVSYAGYMATFTIFNHLRFRTFTWDLSQFDSEFYNTLHGMPFRCPILVRGPAWSDLAGHAHFAVWLLTPFYALHPAAETLLVLQALIVGVGAIPLYRFAARRLPKPSALVVACAYLLYPPLHGAQFFDIHFQPIAAGFILLAIDFLDERRMGLFTLFFVASLACREDVSIGFAAIGLYILLFTRRAFQGAAILGISVVYFGLMRFVIMPAFGSWGFADFYKQLIPAGQSGFGAVLVTLIVNPLFVVKSLFTAEKLRYALQILTPLSFLPLSRPRLWLSLALGTIVTLLTAGAAPLLDIGFQYGGSFAPYVFLASVLALSLEGRSPLQLARPGDGQIERRVSLLALCLGTLLSTWHFGAIPPRASFHTAYNETIPIAPLNAAEKERLSQFNEVVALIPKNAIVAAGDKELPHVSNRIEAWNMHMGYDGADFLLFDPSDPQHQDARVGAKARNEGWTVLASHPRVQLLKKPH